ncbi:MAG: hypothetical protein A2902_00775 [Elusimicrobia bacterium RIFCSPLOWO2_01_FULL_64_13]|nr:MAG: hypothetical protein A2902_00775 [Elusimicrobia bacterium RIFCSPLOWO2_01_FULL_64_13]
MTMETKMTSKLNGKIVVTLALALGLLAPTLAQAAFSDKAAGTRTGQFLKLPVGARIIGMGEAGTAVVDDVNSIYYNVAGLARLEKKSAEYMYSGIFLKDKTGKDSNPGYHWVAYAMPISEAIGSVGLGLQYFNAGDITKTDIRATDQGTFSPSDLAFNLAYARKVMDIPVGLDLKIISSKIEETATTVAVDFGAQYDKLLGERLALGFAAQNIGGKLKFETESDKLPILIRLGSAYKVKENWLGALDVVFPEDNSAYLALGTEYKHELQNDMSLSGRLGYNSRARRVDGFNGVTVGFGFGFQMGTVDYAWMPLGDLGQTHRFSVGVKF